MREKKLEKEKAIELRKEGRSVRSIAKILKVSKSSVSIWVRDIVITIEQRKVLDENSRLARIRRIPKRKKVKCGSKKRKIASKENWKKLQEIEEGKYRTKRRKMMGEENWEKYQKERKRRNNKRKNLNAKFWAERRLKLKKEYVEYKGRKCKSCGYNKCLAALEFHHKNPKDKKFSISKYKYKLSNIKKELDKCDLLCRNCHAEEHDRLNNQKRNMSV